MTVTDFQVEASSVLKDGQGKAAALALATLVALGAIGGLLVGSRRPAAQLRTFHVVAHRYGYDPPVIRVNKGDTVKLTFASLDVTHGFYLEGYDLDVTIRPLKPTVVLKHPSSPGNSQLVEEVTFLANREGKFRYRCSTTCGFLHPFMLGELIVGPNRLLPASIGMTFALILGSLLVAIRWKRHPKAGGQEKIP